MAATGKSGKTASNALNKPVFWASTGMTDKQETVVPGVNTVGNMRPRVKGGKTKEVRAYIPVKQPVVETTDLHGTKTSFGMTSDLSTITDVSHLKSKQVSLRDLCVEDKKRVANLIKELARVVEEKENAEHNLASERNHYQEQILKLVEQQETVLKEREDVQNKLLEYQNLIVKLQQEQQLHHLKRQQERQRQLHQKSPATETKMGVPVPSVSMKGVKGQTSGQSGRHEASNRNIHQDDVRLTVAQPEPEPAAGFHEKDKTKDENESPTELPSQNLYMNMLEDSGVEDFSTQVHPAASPPHGNQAPKATSYRPFTAMIDRELAKQHAALTSMDHAMLQEHNAQQSLKEQRARDMEQLLNEKTSKRIKSSPRSNRNVKDGTFQISHEKRNRNAHVEQMDGNADFVLQSHPFVSPEKAEIFSRFMHSQSKDVHCHDLHDLKRSERETRMEEEKKSNGLNVREKQRRRKPPPASYGVLHPPVMSSTQKSSEIGDYVNSTINSDRKVTEVKEDGRQNVNKRKDEESDEGSDDVDGLKVINGQKVENDDMENIARDKAGRIERRKKSKHKSKSRVEFSDQPAASKEFQAQALEGDSLLGVDPDYLSYYKNLSGMERKKELLKQRTKLLEEQNKLRKILAEQENKLMLKQAEVDARREAMQEVGQGDQVTMSKVQDSLEEMEFRLAQKEEAIRREKEMLEQKRKEQMERRSCGLKSTETTDAVRSEKEDSHYTTYDKPEHKVKVRPSLQEELDAGTEVLNKALILARDDVPSSDRKVPEQTDGGLSDMKANLVTENSGIPSKQPISGQGLKSTSAAFGVQKEDDLARRLEFSYHSDGDQPTASRGLEVKSQGQGQTFPKTDALKSQVVNNPSSHLENPEGKMDAGTSISFAHLGPNASAAQKGENLPDSREGTRTTGTNCLTQSPGDKTLAVIEIINSLDDLDDLSSTNVNSVPTKTLMVKGRHEASTRKTKALRKKQSVKPTTSQPDQTKQQVGVTRSKPGLSGDLAPSDGKKAHLPSLRFGHIKGQRERGPGFRALPVTCVEDSELDFFHLPQFREERLEGCRRLANRDTDEDSDDISYDYDDNDDSNLDDIVNALSRSFSPKEGEEDRSGDEDGGLEFVGSDWDDGFRLELGDDLALEADSSSGDEKRNFRTDRETKRMADDNDILEEIFFAIQKH